MGFDPPKPRSLPQSMVVATLHTSVTAFSPVKDSKSAIENGAASAIVDSLEVGRLLRRVDNDYDDVDDDDDDLDDDLDDDEFDEERGFGESLKKLNPITAVKKSAKKTTEQVAKIKKTMADVADYQTMLEKAREMVNKD
ncbi:hypothetical protein V7S43_014750 [Phytophthora oleae]|uniref:RxLR effector protein n=1 Tax=Phytophthora oleae TaxID=2107226 RepID=A0ABD3F400_9STRA